jgi:hypothetical protein
MYIYIYVCLYTYIYIHLYTGITENKNENIMVAETPISAQENFAKLLKETMDQQNSATVGIDMYICTNTSVYVCVLIYMFICTCVYMYIYLNDHVWKYF